MARDPEKAKARQRRYRMRIHAEKFGPNSGDQRGKHGNHPRGPRQRQWNDGRIISSHGYVKIRVGRGHPLADPNGYAYEHLVVWVSSGRNRPINGETLHHLNGIKTDNRIENLQKLSRSRHNAEHVAGLQRDPSGRFVGKKAVGCPLDDREHNEMPA